MTARKLVSHSNAPRHDVANLVTRMAIDGLADNDLDPFLLLGHHGPQQFPPENQGLPFGPHPHRGFETVTFVVDGELLHRDSGGHDSVIGPGGVQWMTAGAGVVHSETSPDKFLKDGGPLEILQLWVNLPARLKMSPPRYTGLHAQDVIDVPLADGAGTLHLVSGDFEGSTGPIQSLTDVFIAMAAVNDGGSADLPAPAGRTVLFYVVQGSAVVDGVALPTATLARFEADGDFVRVAAQGDALILFGHADPIGEPVVARGPFVMNTEAEIEEAFRDLRAGRLAATPL
jgi:redox-sensitive bicupin YhaK (pirin superfamily)